MPLGNHTTDVVSAPSGAFDINNNLATQAGAVVLATGGTLALGVGVTVLPAPVLGLAAIGSGLMVAGNVDEIKDHFGIDKKEEKPAPAAA